MTHPDLRGQFWKNTGETDCHNGKDDDQNGYIDDCYGWDFIDNVPLRYAKNADSKGHGTSAAGLIAAATHNRIGVAGVCPHCSIMCLRAVHGDHGTTADIARAIDYAVRNGARISNNSYGSSRPIPELFFTIHRAQRHGHLFVTSAGNYGNDNDDLRSAFYPASSVLDNILSVGAINDHGLPANFSNYGQSSVDIFAPGVLLSTTITGGSYDFRAGTSFASPLVAGGAALLWSLFPNADYKAIKNAIMSYSKQNPELKGRSKSMGVLSLHRTVVSFNQTINDRQATYRTVDPPVRESLESYLFKLFNYKWSFSRQT